MRRFIITVLLLFTLVGSVFARPREYTIYDGTELVEMFTADIEDINAKLSKYDWIYEIEDDAEFDATYSLYEKEIKDLQSQIKKIERAIKTTKAYQNKMRIQRDMEAIKATNNIK